MEYENARKACIKRLHAIIYLQLRYNKMKFASLCSWQDFKN